MKIHILDKTKKKKVIDKISYLGIEKFPYLLIQTGIEKIRAFSGSFSNEEIIDFWRLFPIEGIGMYFGKQAGEDIRLSIDALHILKNQITKNIIELSPEQEESWFEGKDVDLTEEQQIKCKELKGFVAVKSEEDIIGTGKIIHEGKTISNFLPKERRRH